VVVTVDYNQEHMGILWSFLQDFYCDSKGPRPPSSKVDFAPACQRCTSTPLHCSAARTREVTQVTGEEQLHCSGLMKIALLFFLLIHNTNTVMASSADDSRDAMMAEVADGAATVKAGIDVSVKRSLARGCDPRMAVRAMKMLSLKPVIGNAELVSVTDDDEFIKKIQSETFDVFFFAPGACRYNAAKQPIPGGRVATKGWTLDNYKTLIQQHAGEHVPIVETTEEREIVPLLRKALGMVDGNEL
jgi:hypothetical protein